MKMSHEEQRKCAGADAVEQQDITGEPVELQYKLQLFRYDYQCDREELVWGYSAIVNTLDNIYKETRT